MRKYVTCRARPWPERPVIAANKSGNQGAALRVVGTYPQDI